MLKRQPITLGLAKALGRIGHPDATVPTFGGDTVQPVVVYGDLSRSIASEIFEARASTYCSEVGAAGDYITLEIASRAPGGIVVETVYVDQDWDILLTTIGSASILDAAGVPLTDRPVQNVGGVACTSRVRLGRINGVYTVPSGNDFGAFLTDPSNAVELTQRIYVPGGNYLAFSGHPSRDLTLVIFWRELADVQGPT